MDERQWPGYSRCIIRHVAAAGASDCASCVGVALELARLLVSDNSRKLQVPVVFLLNGGEEAFLLGAHAFREHSKFKNGLGAIINLESTGPGGPDILFQYSGSWTMKSYAKVASRPRGTVIAQVNSSISLFPLSVTCKEQSCQLSSLLRSWSSSAMRSACHAGFL